MKRNNVMKKMLSVMLIAAMIVGLTSVGEPAGQVQAAETIDIYSEDFETGAVLDKRGTTGSGSHANQVETDNNSYLKLTGYTSSQVVTPGISVEANTEYILSYRIKVADVSGNFYFYPLGQEWNDSNEYNTLPAIAGAVREATDDWQTVEGSYTSSKNHVQFFFEEAWGGSADICLDDITLKNKTTGEIVYQESFDTTAALTVRSGSPVQSREQEELSEEYYLQITGAEGGYCLVTDAISVDSNVTYTLSYRVNMSTVSGSIYFYPWIQEWYVDGNGASGYAANTEIAPDNCRIQAVTDGWVTLEMPYTSTDGKNRVQFYFEQAWGGSADIALDDITLKRVDTQEVVYSVDFNAKQELRVNASGTGGSYAFVADGNHYLELQSVSGGYTVQTNEIKVEEGKQYIFSYRVNVPTVSGSVYFYPWVQEWYNDGSTADGYAVNLEIAPDNCRIQAVTDGWVTLEVPYTASTGKNRVQFYFEQAWPGSADIWLDDIKLTQIVEEKNELESALTFNRVDGNTWYLDADNISSVTGSYYFATINVDGNEQKIVLEKTSTGFVIFEDFFKVYDATASVPQSSLEIAEGTVLYQFDPNTSWSDPVSGGQEITITKDLKVEKIGDRWYEYGTEDNPPAEHVWSQEEATVIEHVCADCGVVEEHSYENDVCTVCQYDMSDAVQFVLYDYTEVEIVGGGWQTGVTTKGVSISNGVISGKTGDGAEVISLGTSDANAYTLEAGVKYRLSLTYKSSVKLMNFYDCGSGWVPMMSKSASAEEWQTISVTLTPDAVGKLAIYVQEWDSENTAGEFWIKDIYLSRISDARMLEDGNVIGTLPNIHRTPSDSSHEFAWCIKNQDTETYTQVTEKTVYDSKTMGNVIYATEVLAPHSSNAHWWTKDGATVMEHKCSVCGATEEHTYVGDVCKVCQFDMGEALRFVLYDYTSVAIGKGGWEVGATTSDVTVSDGVISGRTGATTSHAVLSLYAHSDLNPFVMETGVKYQVSLTYKSEAKLMFFCDDWKNFTKEASAAEEWKTITVTFTPTASRKLGIYVENWDGENPTGEFQIKDIQISRVSDSRIPQDGSPLGAFPEISYEPSDEYHEFVWRIKKKDGSGYITVTPQTLYDSKTMGTEIVVQEMKVYHSILNYVRCDFTTVDSWTTGSAMKAGSYSSKDGILQGTVLSDTSGQELLSFGDGAKRLTLEPGVEYKVIMTYKSSATFGVFMNLKSNAWTEAPGKCLQSSGDEWKTITATFKAADGDVFNGVLIQSWNAGEEYSFQIKDFCIVRADDTRKFAENETLGQIPDCEGEDDALGRYRYEWVVYKKNGEAVVLSSNMSIKSITSALNETGALYAYERIQCVYHMDDGKDYGKAATCMEEGWSPYWVCATCERKFSDSLCKKEITNLEAWKMGEGRLESTGHIYTTELLSRDGITYYYCECNKLFKLDGDTYAEVSITLLDNGGDRPVVDSVLPDQMDSDSDSSDYTWVLVISGVGILIVAAGLTVMFLWRRRKHNTANIETDMK